VGGHPEVVERSGDEDRLRVQQLVGQRRGQRQRAALLGRALTLWDVRPRDRGRPSVRRQRREPDVAADDPVAGTVADPRVLDGVGHLSLTTPSGVQAELGWALGTVTRAISARRRTLSAVWWPRGYQVLAAAATCAAGSQLALGRQLGVDRTVMTYLLDELEQGGLVARTPDPTDRRARRITLTEDGQARLCALERSLRAAEEHLLAPLDAEERAALRGLLLRVATHVGGPAITCTEADELS
jgi:DNA-binding MarR family transcriptional regulator